MITIFCSGKTIQLSDEKESFIGGADKVLVSVSAAAEIKAAYDKHMENRKLKTLFFYHEDENRLMDLFSSMFRVIRAAGGLVKNSAGKYLFIFRHGKWDLPKGKVEKGEVIGHAAVREVEEECGVSGLTAVKELITTYHTYFQGGEPVLKPTHWFRMETADTGALVPQTEEGITAVKWLAAGELGMVKENTFPSILEVIRYCK